jgi:hypothetical protein
MSESKRPAPKDIAILNGPTEDGQGARLVRIREGGEVSTGEIRPLREGEALNQAEVVRLHPLDAEQRVCAVEVLHAPSPTTGAAAAPQKAEEQAEKRERARHENTAGPARVTNAKYRENWSTIFEAPDPRPQKDWSLN